MTGFVPPWLPSPRSASGQRDGCRYLYPRGPCRSPRASGAWCERHAAEWRAEVFAQGGAVVLPFERQRIEHGYRFR